MYLRLGSVAFDVGRDGVLRWFYSWLSWLS
jgi:hypothetical protein